MMMHSGFGDRLNETGGLSHDDAGVLQSQRFAYMGRCITVQSDPMLAIEAGRKREESPWCGPVWSGGLGNIETGGSEMLRECYRCA